MAASAPAPDDQDAEIDLENKHLVLLLIAGYRMDISKDVLARHVAHGTYLDVQNYTDAVEKVKRRVYEGATEASKATVDKYLITFRDKSEEYLEELITALETSIAKEDAYDQFLANTTFEDNDYGLLGYSEDTAVRRFDAVSSDQLQMEFNEKVFECFQKFMVRLIFATPELLPLVKKSRTKESEPFSIGVALANENGSTLMTLTLNRGREPVDGYEKTFKLPESPQESVDEFNEAIESFKLDLNTQRGNAAAFLKAVGLQGEGIGIHDRARFAIVWRGTGKRNQNIETFDAVVYDIQKGLSKAALHTRFLVPSKIFEIWLSVKDQVKDTPQMSPNQDRESRWISAPKNNRPDNSAGFPIINDDLALFLQSRPGEIAQEVQNLRGDIDVVEGDRNDFTGEFQYQLQQHMERERECLNKIQALQREIELIKADASEKYNQNTKLERAVQKKQEMIETLRQDLFNAQEKSIVEEESRTSLLQNQTEKLTELQTVKESLIAKLDEAISQHKLDAEEINDLQLVNGEMRKKINEQAKEIDILRFTHDQESLQTQTYRDKLEKCQKEHIILTDKLEGLQRELEDCDIERRELARRLLQQEIAGAQLEKALKENSVRIQEELDVSKNALDVSKNAQKAIREENESLTKELTFFRESYDLLLNRCQEVTDRLSESLEEEKTRNRRQSDELRKHQRKIDNLTSQIDSTQRRGTERDAEWHLAVMQIGQEHNELVSRLEQELQNSIAENEHLRGQIERLGPDQARRIDELLSMVGTIIAERDERLRGFQNILRLDQFSDDNDDGLDETEGTKPSNEQPLDVINGNQDSSLLSRLFNRGSLRNLFPGPRENLRRGPIRLPPGVRLQQTPNPNARGEQDQLRLTFLGNWQQPRSIRYGEAGSNIISEDDFPALGQADAAGLDEERNMGVPNIENSPSGPSSGGNNLLGLFFGSRGPNSNSGERGSNDRNPDASPPSIGSGAFGGGIGPRGNAPAPSPTPSISAPPFRPQGRGTMQPFAYEDPDSYGPANRNSLSPDIKPFPTSPLPRQSLGNIAVRVRPPPRAQKVDNDYCVPENHMVFFYNARKNGMQRYGTAGSSRSRVAVVGDVFSNWYNRSANFTDFNNFVDIRFAGVSYEGISDCKSAKAHPDSKGRLTVTVNGVVSIYCRTDALGDAVLGDKLEWCPTGSRMSWRQIGKDFEPCLIRKFDIKRYSEGQPSGAFRELLRRANTTTSSSFGSHVSDDVVKEYPIIGTFASMISSVGSVPFDGSNDLLSFSKAQKNDMAKGLGDSHEATSMKNVVQSGFSSHEAHHILPEFDASVKTFASKYPNHHDVLVRNGVLSASHGKCSLNLDNMFTTSGSLKPGVNTAFSALSSSMKSHAVGRIASGLKDAMVRHHTSDSGFGLETGTYSKMFSPAAKSVDTSSAMQTIMETSSSFNATAREFGVSMPSYDLVNVKHATSTLLNAMDGKLQPLGSSAETLFSDVNGDRLSPQDSRALRGALSTLSSQGVRTATLMSNVRKVNSMIKDPNVVAFAEQNGDVFAMTGKSAAAAASDFGKSVGAYLDAKSIATDTSGLLGPYFEGSRNNSLDSKSTYEFFGQAVSGLSSTDASEFIAAYPTSAAFSDYANMCALGMGVGAVGGSNAEKYFDPSIGKLNFQSSSYDTAMSMPPTSSDFSTTKFVTDRNANSVMASCLLAAAHKNPSQVDNIMGKFTFTKVATKSRMSPVNVVFEEKTAAEAYSNHNSHKTIGDVERNEHGDFVVRFAPISTSTDFKQWFDGHKKYGTSAKAVFTDALDDTMASLNSSIKTHNEAARKHLAKVYESRFGPLDGQASHLAAMMHDDASAINDRDMISTFGKFFVGKRATNPCHALDNPYLLVHAALPSEEMVECSSHGAIRPNSVECITSSDFSPLASDTKMMKVARSIRPTNTMAPFLIATSSLSDSPATSGRIVHAFVSNHESTQSPLSAVTTSMNMAKKLLSPEEYKTRAKMVGTKSIASKNHLLGALGSSLSQDARHLTTSQKFALLDENPVTALKSERYTYNPYARVFGTLLDIDKEANTIRVMLNPALSNAPVHVNM